jgi:tetratricopeptide (TPR) repeat protein
VPEAAFFSFITPPPTQLDYYWLSQLLYHAIYSVAGYVGLVRLRTLVSMGTYALVLATLRIGKGADGWGWSAVVFTAVALVLVGRLTLTRPCDLSYLAIAAFLFSLESRRALAMLPPLAVLWMNLHGIEYPVMLLILGGYLGEWVLARAGLLGNVTAPPWRAFALAGAAMLAVLATPNGLALIPGPFQSLHFASQYIDELKPVDIPGLFTIHLDNFYVTRPTFITLLLGGSFFAALASLRRDRLRPAHLVLLAGGLVLLTRTERFRAEFVLLVVPLVGAFRPRVTLAVALPAPLRAALLAALAALPFWHVHEVLETRCTFPLCPNQLPVGTAAFLEKVGATGPVLNHPNDGGYLEWALHPRQQIFVDLQTPFLFSDRDVFAAQQAFRDPAAFANLVAEHKPAFVVAQKGARPFGAFVSRVANYAPVFFDDDSVVYASGESQADLVSRMRLTAIDPYTVELVGDATDANSVVRATAELARVNEIFPGGAGAGVAEGELALRRGDTDAAMRIAERVTRERPERADGMRLRGDVYFRRQSWAEAAKAYESAVELAEIAKAHGDSASLSADVHDLDGRLWACYSHAGRDADAYRALRRALGDLYRPQVTYQDLASLALAALKAGRDAEGRTLLAFALAKTPESEAEMRRGLESRIRSLDASR